MNTPILQACIALIISLPLMAEEALKVELIVPAAPVVIEEGQLAEAAKAAEAKEAYQAEMNSPKPDMETLKRLEPMAMKGDQLQQGIDLKVRLTNTSEAPVTFDFGGDSTTNTLSITGPGAVNCPFEGMMTMEFRMGKSLTIDAGKSEEFVIKDLKYGKRDTSRWLITKAGEYQVTLTFHTNMDRSRVELKSEPVTLKVVSK